MKVTLRRNRGCARSCKAGARLLWLLLFKRHDIPVVEELVKEMFSRLRDTQLKKCFLEIHPKYRSKYWKGSLMHGSVLFGVHDMGERKSFHELLAPDWITQNIDFSDYPRGWLPSFCCSFRRVGFVETFGEGEVWSQQKGLLGQNSP